MKQQETILENVSVITEIENKTGNNKLLFRIIEKGNDKLSYIKWPVSKLN